VPAAADQVPDLAAQPTPEIDGSTWFPGGLGGKQFRQWR